MVYLYPQCHFECSNISVFLLSNLRCSKINGVGFIQYLDESIVKSFHRLFAELTEWTYR